MREILFRGKRIDNGEWVEGFIVTSRENTYPNGFEMITIDGINYDELDSYIPDFIYYAVDPSTVGQYTGLTDKNGIRIYEGDIVKIDEKHYDVKFVMGQFFFGINMPIAYKRFDCEVIGNIHDNKSLLNNQEAGE